MADTIPYLIGLVFLIFCSAFFSGAETAMFSLSTIQVRKFSGQKQGRGPAVASLISRPRNLLISLLIGNMIVNILTSSLSASFFRGLLGGGSLARYSETINVSVMTILIIVFGEIAPKAYAIQNSERLALAVSPVIRATYVIFAPLRVLLFYVTNGTVLLATKMIGAQESGVSEDELKIAATLGHSSGAIGLHEKELIHGVLRLEHRSVEEMMTTRMDMVAFDINTPIKEIVAVLKEKKYMRVPVYEGDVDNIRGILYVKDLFRFKGEELNTAKIPELLRPAYFVPETLEVDVLLDEFKKRRTHMAVAVDEYGSVSGLITLEDVLEIIVGNIYDKVDEAKLYEIVDANTMRVHGRLPIEDLNEIMDLDILDEYVLTVGGHVSHVLGRIPKTGEKHRIEGVEYRILKASRSKIDEMLIRKLPEVDEE